MPRADGRGRVAALEIMVSTARTRELIEDKDRTKELHDAISQGTDSYGMQSFDQSLMGLVKSGLVAYDEAVRQATNPDDFALARLSSAGVLDTAFSTDGKVTTPFGASRSDRGLAMAIKTDRLYVAGGSTASGTESMAIAAYLLSSDTSGADIGTQGQVKRNRRVHGNGDEGRGHQMRLAVESRKADAAVTARVVSRQMAEERVDVRSTL